MLSAQMLASVYVGWEKLTVVRADGDSNLDGYETGVKWRLKLTSFTANYSLICYKTLKITII